MSKLTGTGKRVAVYMSVALFALFAAVPFIWMIITAFKEDRDLYRSGGKNPFLYNDPPTMEHVNQLFTGTNFMGFVQNSVFVGIVVVIITLLLSVLLGTAWLG